jgi:hypothetical protein
MSKVKSKGAGATGAASLVFAVLLAGGAAAVQPPWAGQVQKDGHRAELADVVVQDISADPRLAAMIRIHRYSSVGFPEQRLAQPLAKACCASASR